MKTAEQIKAEREARATKLAALKAVFRDAEEALIALPGAAQDGYDAAATEAAIKAYEAAKMEFSAAYLTR